MRHTTHVLALDVSRGAAALVLGCASPATTVATFGALAKHIPKDWIVLIFLGVVDAYMTLEVVRAGVFMFAGRTAERADVTGRFVDEAVSNHLVLALEPMRRFRTRTILNGAKVRTVRRMHVRMRAK